MRTSRKFLTASFASSSAASRSSSAQFARASLRTPDSQVAQGYIIARQDCFRCHNSGAEGGTKAGRSWMQVGEMAMNDPLRFRAMIHDPKSVLPDAKSPAQPDYDNATLDALTAYFRTFSHLASRPGGKPTP